MRSEVLLLILAVGASSWAFRALPFRLDLSGLAPEGRLGRLLAATGPAAIAALFAASALPLLGQGAPLWGGSLAVLAIWFARRSVVLATLSGAAACGLATYAGLGTPGI